MSDAVASFINYNKLQLSCVYISSLFTVVVEVNFQITSISVTEGITAQVDFTIDISGQDSSSTTTVYLTALDGTASKCSYSNE